MHIALFKLFPADENSACWAPTMKVVLPSWVIYFYSSYENYFFNFLFHCSNLFHFDLALILVENNDLNVLF